jgi:hypothetical protein
MPSAFAGRREAVARLAGLGDDLVAEARRQIEHALGILDQRAVVLDLVQIGLGLGEFVLGAGGKGREGQAGGGGPEEVAAGEGHVWPLSKRCFSRYARVS